MDIRELRIGNWVNYPQTQTGLHPARVAEVYKHSVCLELNNPFGLDDYFVVSWMDLITPIPITPESLEMIGFYYDAFAEWWVLKGHPRMNVFLSKKGVWIFAGDRIIIEVQSIHQLQNILASVDNIYI